LRNGSDIIIPFCRLWLIYSFNYTPMK
jgi:hypothetical protein